MYITWGWEWRKYATARGIVQQHDGFLGGYDVFVNINFKNMFSDSTIWQFNTYVEWQNKERERRTKTMLQGCLLTVAVRKGKWE